MKNKRKLAIIGVGPRGGYAFENLVVELAKTDGLSQIHVMLFEESGNFGNGKVYDIKQSKTNWININERILHLDKRAEIIFSDTTIPSFPSYHEWRNKDFNNLTKDEADTYPPRAKVGEYLEQRFQSLVSPLLSEQIVSLIKERVQEVRVNDQNKIILKTATNIYENIDEILLTIGHQPTETSKQIFEWDKFAANKRNISLFKSPYPVAAYLNSESLTSKSRIGIRGFGLAMIDVARGIADRFGKFTTTNEKTKSCKYLTSYDIEGMLIPFSLDGLPPAPKPLNAEIDEWFKPNAEQISDFENKIGNRSTQRKAVSPRFLINAFAPIAAEVYLGLPKSQLKGKMFFQEIERTIKTWMRNQKQKHLTIIPTTQSTLKTMQDFVGMAIGEETVSLDYCIGQVWRHCQPSIYEQLSYNECSEEVFAEIIALDEGTKRYSYGPPVESIQQMIALVKAGIMILEMANNPEFRLTDDGWCFQVNGKSMTVNMMIDSVLNPPKIEAVSSSIVKNMLTDDYIESVHDKLGILTDENAYVISRNVDIKPPIALLGRLAKGTVIGVDAILECFGSRPQNWATEAAKHHVAWLESTSVV